MRTQLLGFPTALGLSRLVSEDGPAIAGAGPGRAVLTLPVEQPWLPAGHGNRVRVLAGPGQTGGRLTVLAVDVAKDYVSALHSHEDADKTLCVLGGTLSVFLDGQRRDVGPGTALFIPRGRAHAHGNCSGRRLRLLAHLSPSGFEGFLFGRQTLEERYGVESPTYRRLLQELAERYHLRVLGPPPQARPGARSGVNSRGRPAGGAVLPFPGMPGQISAGPVRSAGFRGIPRYVTRPKELAMSKKLSGKVAVVTGASKGIGAEIARHLAAEGAAVVVNYASSKAWADKVVADITGKGGKAVAVRADVAKADDVRKLFAETKKAFGRLDVLVNNAGVYEYAPLEAITAEHYHRLFNLNVLGLILATQEAVKHFGPDGGSVVNIGSIVGKLAFPTTTVYAATKAAVDSITRTLGAELGPKKVRVNAVNPGMVETEGNADARDPENQFRKMVEAQTPLGRIGQVDDVAPAVAYFASDDAKWVTGETIYIAGGYR
jgi:3-oxoacyl-[acyl-carrier protein] reductase